MAFVVFAGQSNMGGLYMDVSTLPAAWSPSPLTQIWDSQSKSWVEMQPGVNTGYAGQPNTWGPEVQFAIDFRAAFPNEVLHIVKEVDGGTPLNQDTVAWHYDWSPNSQDELFARTASLISDASASLGGAHPTAVFWGQGEEDGNTAAAAQAYGDNLSAFFTAVRAQWMADPTGKIGYFQIDTTTPHAADVRAGEVRVDQADPNAASFDTAGYPLQGDNLHYAAGGYTAAGDNFFQLYDAWRQAGALPPDTPPGSSSGQTLTSHQYADTLSGGAGADTLNAGQGPDLLTGGAGADSFVFAQLPWNAGHVSDFAVGADRLDLSALLAASGYQGSDPVADGYVSFVADGNGGTEVLYDTDGRASGATVQYRITDLDHVAPGGLTWAQLSTAPSPPAGGGGTGGPPGQVLTSHQYADTLSGGAGADTLNAGQGPDLLTGGAGGDSFVFAQLPWNAGHVSDFAVGVDHLDLSALLAASGYQGSDPVADGYVSFVADGNGGTEVLYDTDGRASGATVQYRITDLDHVAPNGLTWAQLSSGAAPSPPAEGGGGTGGTGGQSGQVLTSASYGDHLAGGAGADTLNAGQGPDSLTGGAGADRFVFAQLPWNAGHVTDFTPGTDTLDLRALFQAAGYQGSDPLADHRLEFRADGSGSTQVYFDADGNGANSQWPTLITTLDGVAPSQIGAGDWLFR
ncbi:hypothetical protein DJ021_12600 [Phenylobacterium hankyongense]|uniref:Sialate O-acetylesterase domain-containing protein n=1 Tax=Phenylobacterium hankyongense TaxID=1813876 RepID=A0A328B410_9CAUL|nr:type I secretion C-terminal target domain-containing protein [Phenylobacterium hankyongense]RAK60584.1 hypothetical protein DJ021_12600 [Phenylobacterium hankyongense]